MICLDTNAVIAAINQRKPRVRRRLEQALVDRVIIGIPAVVLYEIWYGIRKRSAPERPSDPTIFLSPHKRAGGARS